MKFIITRVSPGARKPIEDAKMETINEKECWTYIIESLEDLISFMDDLGEDIVMSNQRSTYLVNTLNLGIPSPYPGIQIYDDFIE